MKNIHILLFYKYVDIENPKKFVKEHLKFCKELGVLGKVLVGEEGINGSVSGTKEQVEKYKEHMREDERFSDMAFKEDIGKAHPFTRIFVRLRKEIVTLGKDVNLKNTGKYLSPKELLEMYNKNEEFIILDARNDYEYRVGKFKNATHLNIKTFRQFPEALEKDKELQKSKDKKIVMYCTGGIRCEKASALLKEEGFKDVSQIDGGIMTFCKEFPDTVWEGNLFVFDKRLVTPINKKDIKPLTECEMCNVSCDLHRNCRNNDCDKLFIECVPCQEKMNGCCSKECLKEFRIQCVQKSIRNQGRRQKLFN